MRIANAPCSWGVLEFDRTTATAPFGDVLDELRLSGYDGTELGDWGFMPTDPGRLRHELQARHLALVGAFVPVALARPEAHDAGVEAALRTARLLTAAGFDQALIVLSDDNASVARRESRAGRLQPGDGLDDAGWNVFAAGADRIARAVREDTGLRSVFHAHCAGYVETPGEIGELMARTDPRLLGLCLDTGHILYGGGDPVAVLERHAPRVWHVHFKDCDPAVARQARSEGLGYLDAVRRRLFAELGTGAVDFTAIVGALRRHAYDGWIVVEQDVFPGDGTPAESARRSRAYLASLGL
ncbi:MAG: TIM barrel protein [Vicinamibacterales bacterium]